MITSTCPSRETLFQYSVGALNGEQRDALDEHLEGCPDCQATIMTLDDADDTVAGRLRTPPSSESFLAEPELHEALAAAMAMPLSSPRAEGGAGLDGAANGMPWTLGEYHVLEELGRGGMGRVYKALHTKLDRVVAVKILSRGRGTDPQALSRFEREMRAVGRISHPNVVQAYDAREIDGMPVIIMELVEGLDLAELVRRCTHHAPRDEYAAVPVAEACELVRRTALALQCAHEHGLVHRDIKPSNIMLTPTGEVKLLDLGLARFYAEGGSSLSPLPDGEEMTGTGQAMGTADYMAPEQASDSRTVDIRADIYSLGCTLYKLLSGRAPFSGAAYRSTLDKLNAHVHQPIPPIRDFAPEVPDELAAILDRMLAKDPGQRFTTPAEVAAALAPFCRDANLTDLLERAMASDNGPLSFRERAKTEDFEAGSHPSPPLATAPPRRPVLRRILVGLGFFGAMAAAFAAGIIITIKKNGENYQIEVQKDSRTVVDKDGNATVEIAGKPESTKPTTSAAAELKALEGRWRVVRVEKGENSDASLAGMFGFDGSHASPANLGLGNLNFKNGTLDVFDYTRIADRHYGYVIDPSAAPKTIDLTWRLSRQEKALEVLGIYEIDGDRLRLCLARRMPEVKTEHRPTQFAIEPRSGDILVVLDRYHPSDDEKAMQGWWNVIDWIEDGKPASSEGIQSLAGYWEDDQFRIDRDVRNARLHPGNDGQSVLHLPFSMGGGEEWKTLRGQGFLDAAKQPKTITIAESTLDGRFARNAKEVFGIYKFDGDRLLIAYRQDGPRPETFESAPGSGVILLVLQRPKAAGERQRPEVLAAAPPEVAVVRPVVRQFADHVDFTGQTEAAQTAEVRSRVSGRLAKVLFQPGSTVKQGDPLFEIDPAPFQAELDKREAEVRLLQLRVNRAKAGVESFDEAEAALAAAQQGLKVARLNLDATRLTAPISGRIGRPLVAVGSLVTDAMPLAAIDSVDPVCVAFKVDERTLLELRRNPPHLQGQSALPVLVGVIDEKGYPHKSKVESADTRVDPATATARWRALLPNPDGLLLPGMFVRVRLVTSDPYPALLVPDKALFDKSLIRDVQTPDGPRYSGKTQISVLIVTEQNVVQGRDVERGLRDDDGMLVVKKGLHADDWVIENGIGYLAREQGGQIYKPLLNGMTVKPVKPPVPASPSTGNGSGNPPTTARTAELKLYGGKTFEQWRDLARTDLDRETRVKAFAALGAFATSGKSDDAVAAIRDALKVDQPFDALKAAYSALRMTGPQGEAAIIGALRGKDSEHRKAAIHAVQFGRSSKDIYAIPALIEALDDPDPMVRRNIGSALANLAVATEFEIKSDGSKVRIRPKGEIGPTTKAVVPVLSKLLRDADSGVQGITIYELDHMGELEHVPIPDLIAFVEATVKAESEESRKNYSPELSMVLKVLGDMGPAASAAVPMLKAIIQSHNDVGVGRGAIKRAAEDALYYIQGGKRNRENKPGSNRPGDTKPVGPKGGGSRPPAGGTNGPAAAGSAPAGAPDGAQPSTTEDLVRNSFRAKCHWLAQWIVTFVATRRAAQNSFFSPFSRRRRCRRRENGEKRIFGRVSCVAKNVSIHWASQWH
jgi:RND family efflux transporter MFP subunit